MLGLVIDRDKHLTTDSPNFYYYSFGCSCCFSVSLSLPLITVCPTSLCLLSHPPFSLSPFLSLSQSDWCY